MQTYLYSYLIKTKINRTNYDSLSRHRCFQLTSGAGAVEAELPVLALALAVEPVSILRRASVSARMRCRIDSARARASARARSSSSSLDGTTLIGTALADIAMAAEGCAELAVTSEVVDGIVTAD